MKLVVYGIVHKPIDKCVYTGSTEFDHWKRYGTHLVSAFTQATEHLPLYRYMREHGIENFEPRVLESVDHVDHLREREQHFQDLLRPRCNVRKAFRTEEEKAQYMKRYYRANPDKWVMYAANRKRKLKELQDTRNQNDPRPQ